MPEHQLKAFNQECRHGCRPSAAFIREEGRGGCTTWIVRVPYCGKPECEESQVCDEEPMEIQIWPRGTLPMRYE
jgi:hypothetical protein